MLTSDNICEVYAKPNLFANLGRHLFDEVFADKVGDATLPFTIISGHGLKMPAPLYPEQELADEILKELHRARTKFPGKNVTLAALVEEVGELATAMIEESRARVRAEAIQVACMAMRVVLDGDHTLDGWRATHHLDKLTED